ncbi:MAG: ABC transporter permease subunit [Candidatus Cloacimonadaceae bacterium]|nr:ABC transporter permease subunit [Candidatus Cloacimonadaceae bacterium]MDP3113201.1 ABC transporter permease subunit [Candidatus Cloacimonadaceae bacterium]
MTLWTSLSWLLGAGIGYWAYKSRLSEKLMLPVVNLMRHISPFCWLPLIILISGIGELSVGLVLLLAMLFNAIVISISVFRGIPRDLIENACLDGACKRSLLKHIELPLSLSGLIDLYRVLWSVAWTTIIAAEMLGVSSGLGYRLLDFRYLLRYKEMLTYILVIGIIGIVTDYALLALKKKLARRKT